MGMVSAHSEFDHIKFIDLKAYFLFKLECKPLKSISKSTLARNVMLNAKLKQRPHATSWSLLDCGGEHPDE